MKRGILKRLLIHTIEHTPFIKEGMYGAEYGETKTIRNVRVEYKTDHLATSVNESDLNQILVFIDAIDSIDTIGYKLNKDIKFKVKDKIRFNNQDFIIKHISYEYDSIGLHHLEITASG